MELDYHVVDVFTTTPLEGNALAVFPDASRLNAQTMQSIARELNLPETTFIIPQERRSNDARVRIFTPRSELEFAGHPTIGTAYVLRSTGIVDRNADSLTLIENVGPVAVRVEGDREPLFWLMTPPIEELGTFPRSACAAAISLREDDLLPGIPCEGLSAGNPMLFIPVRDAQTVDRAVVDSGALDELFRSSGPLCTFVFAPHEGGAYSRMFAPHLGVSEDPGTGSATGPLAVFMMRHALVEHADGTRFISQQGTKMQRRSILHVLVHGDYGRRGIEVGGNVRAVAKGALDVPVSR
jgi:trans-2,3-dihydro-3-hydroxyanthranilate isomerase